MFNLDERQIAKLLADDRLVPEYRHVSGHPSDPTGCMGLPDYLGWNWQSIAKIPIVCVPGCPVQPDNFMETLLYLLYMAAGRAPMMARDGRVVWFHCDARMVRHSDGSPWFIHGVAFDISDLKGTEQALQQERNVVSAILDTVGALVTVLDPEGRIVRFNRACELTTGYALEDVRDKHIWNYFFQAEEVERARSILSQLCADLLPQDFQSHWVTRHGAHRLIAWSCSMLPGSDGTPNYIIATGIDITEREQLERALLEISAREQRRIGQDLHDGLGQHLTGIAFMAKVHEAKLAEKQVTDAADAAKIVKLVNEAIHKTRELARGLLPVVSDAQGLMSALQVWAGEVEDLFGISCRFECETVHRQNIDPPSNQIFNESSNLALSRAKLALCFAFWTS